MTDSLRTTRSWRQRVSSTLARDGVASRARARDLYRTRAVKYGMQHVLYYIYRLTEYTYTNARRRPRRRVTRARDARAAVDDARDARDATTMTIAISNFRAPRQLRTHDDDDDDDEAIVTDRARAR